MSRFVPNYSKNKKRTVNVPLIIQQLLKNWWLLLVGTLIAAMLIYVFVTETYEQTYTTSATVAVAPSGSQSSSTLTNLENSRTMALSFVELLNSSTMRNTILHEIGMKSFNGKITATQRAQTNFVSISVTADSPKVAFDVINSILDNHTIVTEKVLKNVSATVLISPKVPSSPNKPINRKSQVIKYSGVAFLLLAACSVLKTIFSNKIYNEADFENKVGSFEKLATIDRQSKRGSSRGRRRAEKGKSKTKKSPSLSKNFVLLPPILKTPN